MKHQKNLLVLALLASVAVTGTAQASLFDRGDGLIYDTDLNATWLANANLAASNTFGVAGIGADGRMTWDTANSWIAGMDTANYLGYSDWRLPTTPNLTSSIGTNQTSSELGHMFYSELGGASGVSIIDSHNSDYALFSNVNSSLVYWSGTEYVGDPASRAWFFTAFIGYQNNNLKTTPFYAWAVRSGDVSAVPVPGAVWFFGSGLLALLGFKNRKVV
jgi:hypothetical protein